MTEQNLTPVTFYGASDDLVELDTPDRSIYEEYDCWEQKVTVTFTAPNGETLIASAYFDWDGNWQLTIVANEFDWQVDNSVRPDRETDPAFIIWVPEGTTAEADITSLPQARPAE